MTDKLKRVEIPANRYIEDYYEGLIAGANKQLESDQLEVDRLNAKIKELVDAGSSCLVRVYELEQQIKGMEALIPTKDEAVAICALLMMPANSVTCGTQFRVDGEKGYAKLKLITDKEK